MVEKPLTSHEKRGYDLIFLDNFWCFGIPGFVDLYLSGVVLAFLLISV